MEAPSPRPGSRAAFETVALLSRKAISRQDSSIRENRHRLITAHLCALTSSAHFGKPWRRGFLGFAAWAADYPAASAFINALFTCNSFRPGDGSQVNIAEFCDRNIDTKIKRALVLQASDPAAAGPLWADIDHRLVDKAPWVPTHTSNGLSLLSKRVGNYQYNPQWGVLLDQFWVR